MCNLFKDIVPQSKERRMVGGVKHEAVENRKKADMA
jgi:hypothetical protein